MKIQKADFKTKRNLDSGVSKSPIHTEGTPETVPAPDYGFSEMILSKVSVKKDFEDVFFLRQKYSGVPFPL